MANINRKWTKWIAGFDPHGVYQDKDANDAFFKFLVHWQPDVRIAGGDICDFKQLRKKADAHEKRESMAVDLQAGKEWMEKLQPTHFLRGNHDERLWDLSKQSEGIVADYSKLIVRDIEEMVTSMRCVMYPYSTREGIMRLGSLKVFHGFRTGVTAARMSAKTFGSCMFGHVHQFQCATIESDEQKTGYAVPCLAQLKMDYNRHQEGALAHEHGWSYGVVDFDSGYFHVWVARKFGSHWLLPTGLEIL